MTQIFNIKTKKEHRRELRQNEIGCEKIMWHQLRNRAFGGYKFRRQFSIGKYIVDFYCPELKLVVELDGESHVGENEVEYDKIRQRYIEDLGIKVKRYNNKEVKECFNEVLNDLLEVCNNLKQTQSQTSP